jgi:hypothetical protein
MIATMLRWKNVLRFGLIALAVVVSLQVLVSLALAEYHSSVPLSDGSTGFSQTYGSPGGNATGYNGTSSSKYYLDSWIREMSTYDYIHVIDQKETWAYWTTNSGSVTVAFPDLYYIYVTTKHAWIPYPGASTTTDYTSGRGTSSSAYCWNGGSCY